MRRTQVQLDDRTYAVVRREAYQRGSSISAVVRDILKDVLLGPGAKRSLRIEDLPFVGAGRSRQGTLSPVSERHDDALSVAFSTRRRK